MTFEFQITGLSREQVRRQRNEAQSRPNTLRVRLGYSGRTLSPSASVLVWACVTLIGLYSVNWAFTTVENNPATVLRRLISGSKKVIILPDESNSMDDDVARLDALIDQLRRNEVDVSNRYGTNGGGFSSQGPSNNSLKVLERALQALPEADTVFVFSDFLGGFDPYLHPDNHDAAGLEQLRQLIRGRRLYLGTVEKDPPPQLLNIARESGGGLFQVVQ